MGLSPRCLGLETPLRSMSSRAASQTHVPCIVAGVVAPLGDAVNRSITDGCLGRKDGPHPFVMPWWGRRSIVLRRYRFGGDRNHSHPRRALREEVLSWVVDYMYEARSLCVRDVAGA